MKYLKYLITICFLQALTCYILPAYAQTTSQITGEVIDADNEELLMGANVYIKSLNRGAITGYNGDFSISELKAGTYEVTISFIGYQTKKETITLREGETRKITIRLKAEIKSLGEVVIMAKSEARKIRDQAMPVSVISSAQLSGSVSDVSDILNKTMGVTIRSQGGVGSRSRLSVRGLEGKRIGFFIDDAPMNDHSDFVDINDIPISMIERIEIYKGVVPAKFGGSGMGGAINVVLKEYPPRYLDVSYAIESFNTHKATAVVKRNLTESGIEIGAGGYYTYSDNDYEMESPFQKGLIIKRDHNRFESGAGAIGIKARKWYFDELEITLEAMKTRKQIQGIFSNIREAHTKSFVQVVETSMKKKDFIIPGLDMDFAGAAALTNFNFIDTAMQRYNWQMEPYIPVHPLGGEMGTTPSDSTVDKFHVGSKLNLNYIISEKNALNLHISHSYASGKPVDLLKDRAVGYKTNYDSKMNSAVIGMSYDYKSLDDRLLNSLTGKYYFYSMQTTLRELTISHLEIPIDLSKHYWGISNSMRYRFTSELMGKVSLAYEVRTPTENELIGDGYLLAPSGNLLPERGTNANVGAIWDKKTPSGMFQVEVNFFGNYLTDMIRQTRNIIQTQYENFGEMRSLGAEAEIKADILSWMYGYVNVTYQDLRDTRKYEFGSKTENPTYMLRMPNIPYLMANGGIEFHKENFFGGKNNNTRFFTDAAFVEEYFYDFEQSIYQERRIPRSLRIDTGVEYSMLGGELIFTAKLGNITGAKLFSEYNYPLPGRTFSLRLRYVLK